MQILQFLLGGWIASAYAFIAYDIPIETRSGRGDLPVPAVDRAQETIANPAKYQTVRCMDAKQTISLWVGTLYLIPLTYLFVKFFVKSYIHTTKVKKQ